MCCNSVTRNATGDSLNFSLIPHFGRRRIFKPPQGNKLFCGGGSRQFDDLKTRLLRHYQAYLERDARQIGRLSCLFWCTICHIWVWRSWDISPRFRVMRGTQTCINGHAFSCAWCLSDKNSVSNPTETTGCEFGANSKPLLSSSVWRPTCYVHSPQFEKRCYTKTATTSELFKNYHEYQTYTSLYVCEKTRIENHYNIGYCLPLSASLIFLWGMGGSFSTLCTQPWSLITNFCLISIFEIAAHSWPFIHNMVILTVWSSMFSRN